MNTGKIQNNEVEWEVLNPIAEYEELVSPLAPRLTDLNGKTVGLCWNGKPNSDVMLKAVGKALEERVRNIKLMIFQRSENQEGMVKQCDAVISGVGD
jgi:hypothetical protein